MSMACNDKIVSLFWESGNHTGLLNKLDPIYILWLPLSVCGFYLMHQSIQSELPYSVSQHAYVVSLKEIAKFQFYQYYRWYNIH